MSETDNNGISGLDHTQLLELAETRMPFGKYSGRLLIDLPEPYVIWFAGKGFPAGKLGRMLQTIYEIKVNGLEYLFEPLRKTC
ncbi:DUF3820 family protein [Desulfopila aestuarii]|uniref:DUF3820 family protein n=1 Tax=Desulfopila aestuarii DSM 18488 TaxID=1121416 RepID=A0A1M7YA69_9BACT|nr:DUF3820 family protein [Desulfopila aestuarii]SHO49507.1 hypothetical protein SAMN02745220_02869 [Desulfopila aestuarii DSM 18488]